MTKINPLKAIRKTGKFIGYTIVGLIYALTAFVFFAVSIGVAWKYWGAWAITVPFLILIGVIVVGGVGAYLMCLASDFAAWYRRKEYGWDRKHQ